jgi:hypothetical protein
MKIKKPARNNGNQLCTWRAAYWLKMPEAVKTSANSNVE